MAVERWTMQGILIGTCNCDWGCPCNFNLAPSRPNCDGVYVWVIQKGRYGDTPLDGLHVAQIGTYVGPMYEGNGTDVYVIDERADPAQRAALETLAKGDGTGMPWDVFASVTRKRLPSVYAPFEARLDGIRSSVSIGGGRLHQASITRMKNPVTGDEEEIYLDKPTGFTALRTELGMAEVALTNVAGFVFDTAGLYAEYSEFDYTGP